MTSTGFPSHNHNSRFFTVDQIAQPANVTIDGSEYTLDSLSAEAREQIARISAADRRLQEIQVDFVMVQTARAAFAEKLKTLLPA